LLRLSDSRNFSRTLAGLGLIAGPVLFAIAELIDPAWGDDAAAYLSDVKDGKGAYLISGVLWTMASLLFLAGTLGLTKLLRGRRVTLGQFAAGLMTVGPIGLSAGLAFNAFDTVLAEADNRDAAVQIYDSIEDSAAANIYWIFFFVVGFLLGIILLTIALFRRRIVPIWSPILLIVAMVLGFISDNAVTSALSFVLLAAALFPLAQRILSLSDEQWARWEPLGEADDAAAAPVADPQPVVG
jgi:hypothetical protein